MGQSKGGAPPMTKDEKARLRRFLKEDVIVPILDSMIPIGRDNDSSRDDTYGFDCTNFEAGIPTLKRLVDRSVQGRDMNFSASEYQDTLNTMYHHLGLDEGTFKDLLEEPVLGMAAVKVFDYMEDEQEDLDELYNNASHWGGNVTPEDLKRLKDNYTETSDRGAELDRMLDHIMPKLESNMKFRAYFKFRMAQEDANYKEAADAFKAPETPPTATPTAPVTSPTTPATTPKTPTKPGNSPTYVPPGQRIEDLFDMSSMRFQLPTIEPSKPQSVASTQTVPKTAQPTVLASVG